MTSDKRNSQIIRVRIDASRCDGQGVCATVAPELFELDRYGDAYVTRERSSLDPSDRDLVELARQAESMCPRAAIFLEKVTSPPPSRHDSATPQDLNTAGAPGEPGRATLLVPGEEREELDSWAEAGGFSAGKPETLLPQLELAGLLGQGGARFPVARKWAMVTGADPLIVVNGAEREPGTVKDAYLLAKRPFLVLDGALAAAREVGSGRVIVAIPEGEPEIAGAMRDACRLVTDRGLAGAARLEVTEVSRAYVSGEETALIASLQGQEPKPRLRPPYPVHTGLYGRPTLVQNVETLAQVALVNAFGPAWFRESGTDAEPGIGLYSVGPYGGTFELYERPIGYPLRDLITEAGLGGDAAAALVGGFSGGLLRRDQFAVGLDNPSLQAVGARLGTKSVHVVSSRTCPLRVVTDVLTYFSGQTASQCPPCHRGLPDMTEIAASIEDGVATPAAVDDFRSFMETLRGRGICALPDGAATVALSYLRNFPADLDRHLDSGCPRKAADSDATRKVNA